MKKYITALAALAIFCGISSRLMAEDIVWQQISGEQVDIRALAVQGQGDRLYFSSGNTIFGGSAGTREWRPVFRAGSAAQSVNAIAFDCRDENIVYAATSAGLFSSVDKGKNWQRIFRGKNAAQNYSTAVAVFSGTIYLGTRGGLFISKDKGRTWHRASGKLGSSNILAVAYSNTSPKDIYVACPDAVFSASFGQENWEVVFRGNTPEESNNIEEEAEEEENKEEADRIDIKHIAVDPQGNGDIYLAASQGVFRSRDKGKSWQPLNSFGLLGNEVKFLMASKGAKFYAVNRSGIFGYRQERWQELSLGLPSEDIFAIAQDREGNLYAACNIGLFKAVVSVSIPARHKNILELYMRGEPGIKEVQGEAIKYAEVDPQKIKQWRKQAAKRALLPRLTIGMDCDRNKTTSKSVWGIYSSYTNGNVTAPGRHYVGPDDLTVYDQRNWDISLTWDLGDLIWSSYQTSIDVRSRLSAQLRDDVLDEVNKLYFERIRLKVELDNLSIEDSKKRFDKELKIQELSAGLDALTGGYFSQELKK